MSIPERSNWTGKIYLGDKIICDTPCQKYDTSIIILEWRLWRDSTSSRHWWLYIFNNDDFSLIWRAWHTCFWWARIEFNRWSSQFYNNSFTWFKEFRISYNISTDTIHYEMRDTLDQWTVTYQLDKVWLWLYHWQWFRVWMQSNDRYYNHWQFDWFRIKDKNWKIISYIDFNDNQLPSWYSLHDWCTSWLPSVSDWYYLSNWILTLSTDPYCRTLLYDEVL